jgi:hypothetical protein
MAVRKILFQKEETGGLFKGDVIEYEGKSWLVPEWLQGPTAGTLCPARIICLDDLSVSKAEPQYQVDLVLSIPLNRDILEGRKVSRSPLVIEKPDIHLRETSDFQRG